ncbi:hypothetical protein IM40_05230 [Candidatus Paracaedimonas acanthamoebae]|nr:hypothetical protein IM40_05230 [Candidatus Paracaedimonas acanthamoebae]
MSKNKVIILGCGPSGGIPLIGSQSGGFWGACDSTNPKNRRMRASIYVEYEGKKLLIDTSPDLRQQFLTFGLRDIDAVLYTHEHADHTHGIDELRSLFFARKERTIPVYGSEETIQKLRESFSYLFEGGEHFIYPKILESHVISNTFLVQDTPIVSFTQIHGIGTSLGYCFGNVAYSTDVTDFDEIAQECLKGLDVWIIDCLSREPKPSHLHLEKALKWIEKMKPKKAILTHMNPSLDYETLKKELPSHIEPAYDGMVIEF